PELLTGINSVKPWIIPKIIASIILIFPIVPEQEHLRYAKYMHYVIELIPDYIEHLEVEGGRSAKTAENYNHYLERFLEFCGEELTTEQITAELVRKYRLWLNRYEDTHGDELSIITQSYHLIALRGFLKYLTERDIPSLAATKIHLPKVARKQVTFQIGRASCRERVWSAVVVVCIKDNENRSIHIRLNIDEY